MAKSTEDTVSMHVIARAPFELYFDDEAVSVSAKNRLGKFDILPGHADFFSLLDKGDVRIETAKKRLTIPIHNGIITVRGGEVALFVNM